MQWRKKWEMEVLCRKMITYKCKRNDRIGKAVHWWPMAMRIISGCEIHQVQCLQGTGYDTASKQYLTNYLLIAKQKVCIYRSEGNHLNQELNLCITNSSERPTRYPQQSCVLANRFNPSPRWRKQSEKPRMQSLLQNI